MVNRLGLVKMSRFSTTAGRQVSLVLLVVVAGAGCASTQTTHNGAISPSGISGTVAGGPRTCFRSCRRACVC